jgi:hypothetical protein
MNENTMGVWCCLIICGLLAWFVYQGAECAIKESEDKRITVLKQLERSSNVVVHVEFK